MEYITAHGSAIRALEEKKIWNLATLFVKARKSDVHAHWIDPHAPKGATRIAAVFNYIRFNLEGIWFDLTAAQADHVVDVGGVGDGQWIRCRKRDTGGAVKRSYCQEARKAPPSSPIFSGSPTIALHKYVAPSPDNFSDYPPLDGGYTEVWSVADASVEDSTPPPNLRVRLSSEDALGLTDAVPEAQAVSPEKPFCEETSSFLRQIGLAQHIPALAQEEFDLSVMEILDADELKENLLKLGLKMGPVIKIQKTLKAKLANQSGKGPGECVVCCEMVSTHAGFCGHQALCGRCAKDMLSCPICRTKTQFVEILYP
tara:strand:+ start:31292 stop:32233 length:942 start_codon:yes stop_codon:yes gene_type:complete